MTVYPVIAAPPSLVGAVNDMDADPLPALALRDVGASGTVAGTAVAKTVDDSESPTALVAITRNV